jgi:hypothetical protein
MNTDMRDTMFPLEYLHYTVHSHSQISSCHHAELNGFSSLQIILTRDKTAVLKYRQNLLGLNH